jgi:hypothetical protein
MKHLLSALFSLIVLFVFAWHAASAEITDRMLATVNGQLITESDVLWALALDPELQPLDLSLENRKAMLERLIDVKILDQEAEKIPQNEPSDGEITNYINNELIKRFGSEAAFRERLQKVGLEQAALREIARHRIEILKYVDFRFRAFVFVKPEEIERYYREVALPRMRNRGGNVRTLDEMRAEIEAILADEKVNAELDRFFDETRQQAQIVRLAKW